jgi:membrane-associated protein
MKHMDHLSEFFTHTSVWIAYLVFGGIIFVETGILLGAVLPLPGDSLLVLMGVLASQGVFSLWALLAIATTCAILGDSVGYSIGRKLGPGIIDAKVGKYHLRHAVEKTEAFYAAHGTRTLVLARFMPVARTLAPVLAGVAKMPYRQFISYNLIGAFAWVWLVLPMGYFLGQIPGMSSYLHVIVLVIIIVSLMPVIRELRKTRKKA